MKSYALKGFSSDDEHMRALAREISAKVAAGRSQLIRRMLGLPADACDAEVTSAIFDLWACGFKLVDHTTDSPLRICFSIEPLDTTEPSDPKQENPP